MPVEDDNPADARLQLATVQDVIASHPDALWVTGDDLYDLRTTSELLVEWDGTLLDRSIVRVGQTFYAADPVALNKATPVLVLVDSWHSDKSVAKALLHLDYGQWLDGAGGRWTSLQLLERLTAAQLATQVEDEPLTINGDGRLLLRDRTGAPLFVHIDADDPEAFCSVLVDRMSALMRGRDVAPVGSLDHPHWPTKCRAAYAGGSSERRSTSRVGG